MHGEVTWDHLDRLVEAYAAASLYVSELRDLETRISRAAADILRYNGSFDDLTGLLATRSPTRELMTRRIAWAAQHVLRQRAWVVGSKLLVKLPGDSGWASPMLDQMRMLGFVSAGERESEPDFSMGRRRLGRRIIWRWWGRRIWRLRFRCWTSWMRCWRRRLRRRCGW